MNELIENVNNLITTIDDSDIVTKYKEIKKKVEQDKFLLKIIEKYQLTQEEKLKEEILNHPIFREYKHQENEVNFLILGINQELKKINPKKRECHENH